MRKYLSIHWELKKASVLIYSIILTSIALILAVVVMNNHLSLIINTENVEIERKFYQNIKSNIDIFSKKTKKVNSDWGWFLDVSSWSWANIWCRLQIDWKYLVQWDDWIKIWSDWRDDNCDDDNYLWTNSGSSSFEDNDNIVRKTINWFISPELTKNIFWNNSKIEEYIDKNLNNTDTFNVKLWDVTSWFLKIELNWQAELKLIKIKKSRYTDFKEFEKKESLIWTINSWSGYIKNNWGDLELNSTISWSYSFNFKEHDYILMLKNLETSQILNYTVIWTNDDMKWIYINPIIDDSVSNDKWFKVLGYDIIINNKWNILWKMIEMVWRK
jgi:hypothetical protein